MNELILWNPNLSNIQKGNLKKENNVIRTIQNKKSIFLTTYIEWISFLLTFSRFKPCTNLIFLRPKH